MIEFLFHIIINQKYYCPHCKKELNRLKVKSTEFYSYDGYCCKECNTEVIPYKEYLRKKDNGELLQEEIKELKEKIIKENEQINEWFNNININVRKQIYNCKDFKNNFKFDVNTGTYYKYEDYCEIKNMGKTLYCYHNYNPYNSIEEIDKKIKELESQLKSYPIHYKYNQSYKVASKLLNKDIKDDNDKFTYHTSLCTAHSRSYIVIQGIIENDGEINDNNIKDIEDLLQSFINVVDNIKKEYDRKQNKIKQQNKEFLNNEKRKVIRNNRDMIDNYINVNEKEINVVNVDSKNNTDLNNHNDSMNYAKLMQILYENIPNENILQQYIEDYIEKYFESNNLVGWGYLIHKIGYGKYNIDFHNALEDYYFIIDIFDKNKNIMTQLKENLRIIKFK